ncbi:MAG TPA: class I SAM-dependent methyltransferase [Anaerolineaceae bacterium]|nr:class I SAM-dependent methyltransferase [Anaerolineaceae bacterium]
MAILGQTFYDLAYRFSQPGWDDGSIPDPVLELGSRPGGRLLDLGCGTGTHAIYLAKRGFSVVGIDFSPRAIELARSKAGQTLENLAFFVHDVTDLSFLDESFDVILDVGCLHSLGAVARQRCAGELARLTHPGSQFLIWGMIPGHFGIGLTAETMSEAFGSFFHLAQVWPSHLHNQASNWYLLVRTETRGEFQR